MEIKNKNLFLFKSIFISLFLLSSCFKYQLPVYRKASKIPDPQKQARCEAIGTGVCEGNDECEELCDDIFRSRRGRLECYEYSFSFVRDMSNLLEDTERGDVERISPEVLECLLDIEDREFVKAVGKMSRREIEDFFFLVSRDDELARVLEEEDDEFNILKQAISILGSDLDSLKRRIDRDRTLVWLFGSESRDAWDWLNNYVEEELCEVSRSLCPGGEAIELYCRVLLELRDSILRDFLHEARLFEKEYEDEVEDAGYEYEIWSRPDERLSRYTGDFRAFCEHITGGASGNSDNDDNDDNSDNQAQRQTYGYKGSCSLRSDKVPAPKGGPEADWDLFYMENDKQGSGDSEYIRGGLSRNDLETIRLEEFEGRLRFVLKNNFFRGGDIGKGSDTPFRVIYLRRNDGRLTTYGAISVRRTDESSEAEYYEITTSSVDDVSEVFRDETTDRRLVFAYENNDGNCLFYGRR